MLEAVVVCKEGLVVMHMMCGTTVLDPYAVYFANTAVGGCFKAVCETAENCVVGGSAGIVSICICISVSQICCLWIISTSTASTTSSSTTTPLLGLFKSPGLLGIIFFGDMFVAVLFSVICEPAVAALWKDIGFPWWEDSLVVV